MLQSQKQQMEMLLWITDNIKKGFSQEQVMNKAQKIMQEQG